MPAFGPIGIETYLHAYCAEVSLEYWRLNVSGCYAAAFVIRSGNNFSGNWVNFMKHAFCFSLPVQEYRAVVIMSILFCDDGASDIAIMFFRHIRQHAGNHTRLI